MNRRILAITSAAAVLCGAVSIVVPQHATSIIRLGAATVAVLTAALVLAAVGPVVAREPGTSPLDRLPTVAVPPLDPHGLRDARRDLARPTAPGSVPPAVRDRLLDALRSSGIRDADLPFVLSQTPINGGGRDAAGVARTVHRILDTVDPGARHGHD